MEQSLHPIVSPLLLWYEQTARDLPWRRTSDPYAIWISEIMLQQTRVEAVKEYYRRFLEQFPTVTALADASEDTVLKYWEGLGYYSRARNLHKAAQVIRDEYQARLPASFSELQRLPGIGEYTAGAISSIAFGLPVPAVDGNVLRVLSRILADRRPISDPAVKKEYGEKLKAVYPSEKCSEFTQALMELGAMVCVPNGAPDCCHCPLFFCCLAAQKELTQEIPNVPEKKKRKIEKKTVFLMMCDEKLALNKRPDTGLLAKLWELPNTPGYLSKKEAELWLSEHGVSFSKLQKTASKTHIFTHIEWHMRSYLVWCSKESPELFWADQQALSEQYALPTAFKQFLSELP